MLRFAFALRNQCQSCGTHNRICRTVISNFEVQEAALEFRPRRLSRVCCILTSVKSDSRALHTISGTYHWYTFDTGPVWYHLLTDTVDCRLIGNSWIRNRDSRSDSISSLDDFIKIFLNLFSKKLSPTVHFNFQLRTLEIQLLPSSGTWLYMTSLLQNALKKSSHLNVSRLEIQVYVFGTGPKSTRSCDFEIKIKTLQLAHYSRQKATFTRL